MNLFLACRYAHGASHVRVTLLFLKLFKKQFNIIQNCYLVIEGKVSDVQFTGGFVDGREVPGYASIRRYRKAVV